MGTLRNLKKAIVLFLLHSGFQNAVDVELFNLLFFSEHNLFF